VKNILLLLLVLIFLLPDSSAGFSILGKIQNTKHTIYRVSLFHMRNTGEFNVLTGLNLITYTFTDTAGFFTLKTDLLPVEENIYRLHISKIEVLKDTLRDLIQGTQSPKMLDNNNFLFLPLQNSSNISVFINNNDNAIKQHTAYPASSFDQLYAISRAFDSNMNSIIAKALLRKETINSQAEIKNLMEDEKDQLKGSLYQHVYDFIQNINNANASVLAWHLIVSYCNPSLSQKIKLSDFIKNKDSKNRYLPGILREIEDAKQKAKLSFLQLYTFASSFIAVALLGILLWYIKKYKIAQKKLIELTGKEKDVYTLLTHKEIEIFEMIAQGHSNQEIASAQFLELSTIKKHVSNIYSKTGIKNRNEARSYLKSKLK
jgi:DNA-binding CsgD family transcriptional regulator